MKLLMSVQMVVIPPKRIETMDAAQALWSKKELTSAIMDLVDKTFGAVIEMSVYGRHLAARDGLLKPQVAMVKPVPAGRKISRPAAPKKVSSRRKTR